MVWTDVYVLSGVTGETRASATLEKRIPIQKRKIKLLAASPPRKDTIPIQDKNTLGIKKYQSLPPHVPIFPHGFISLRNKANDDNPGSTDISSTYKYDTSLNDQDDSIENMIFKNDTNDDEEYKEDSLQHQHVNEKKLSIKPKKKDY